MLGNQQKSNTEKQMHWTEHEPWIPSLCHQMALRHTYKDEGSVCHHEKAESACTAVCMHSWSAHKVWKWNVALTHLNSWSPACGTVVGESGVYRTRVEEWACHLSSSLALCLLLSVTWRKVLSSLWNYHALCAVMNWNSLELWSPCSPPSLTRPFRDVIMAMRNRTDSVHLFTFRRTQEICTLNTPCIRYTRKPRQAANCHEPELPSVTQSGWIYSSRHSVSVAWSTVHSQHRTVSFAFIQNGAWVMMTPHVVVMSSAGPLLTEPHCATWMPRKRYFIYKVHSLFYVWITSS